ncbi:hypothetical protein Sjap_024529 [Stephania japonica]|uniref:Uncharacterized protein n=1 Tax=Stephania japonica TaxID=461633 RepID=A0AAP0EID9_9MAGN
MSMAEIIDYQAKSTTNTNTINDHHSSSNNVGLKLFGFNVADQGHQSEEVDSGKTQSGSPNRACTRQPTAGNTSANIAAENLPIHKPWGIGLRGVCAKPDDLRLCPDTAPLSPGHPSGGPREFSTSWASLGVLLEDRAVIPRVTWMRVSSCASGRVAPMVVAYGKTNGEEVREVVVVATVVKMVVRWHRR